MDRPVPFRSPCKPKSSLSSHTIITRNHKMEKKYNFVYETTNLINGKIYIGVHSTNDLNDGYLGSGLILIDSIKKYGRKCFKREILQIFSTMEEAYSYEGELVDHAFVNDRMTYNLVPGGKGGLNDTVTVKDGTGNVVRVSLSEFYTNDDLISVNKGKMVVIDNITNETLSINTENFDVKKYTSINKGKILARKDKQIVSVTTDEFECDDTMVGIAKGFKNVISNETGKIVRICIDDFDEGKHTDLGKGFVATKQNGKRVLVSKEEFDNNNTLVGQTKGFVTVTDGKTYFQVSVDDERVLNGELVGVTKNYVVAFNKKTNERCHVTKEEFDKNTDLVGNTFGSIQSEESNRKRSQTLKGKKKPASFMKKVKCPHCEKEGIRSNMKRWHFDNCKFKTN